MNDTIDMNRPKVSLDLELDQLGVALNQGQFRRLLDILEYFSLYARGLPVRMYPSHFRTSKSDTLELLSSTNLDRM